MRLSKIFQNAPTINVQGLSRDSRTVKPGDLYFCLSGISHDGHDFIDEVIDKGAIGIVHSRELKDKKAGAVYIRVNNVLDTMNKAANIFYGHPAEHMDMYGITGTNGKTSVANIIRHFVNSQKPCGYIGTISIDYGNTHLQPDLTTPDSLFLLKTLRDMVNHHMEACALEVSSHGLSQKRVDSINFDTTIFTNFTYDHLDFHRTMENYFDSKALLFSQRTKTDGLTVLNRDDEKYEELARLTPARIVTYGVNKKADYQATDLFLDDDSSRFTLLYQKEKIPFETNLTGLPNIYNLLAAIAAVHERGISFDEIRELSKTIPQIPGRYERIDLGQPFKVIVDFAHTPDGMKKIMEYGAMMTPKDKKMISVFGSAGLRDVAKRKVFGEIADEYCKEIVLTEDDPRTEDPKEIAEQIQEGIKKHHVLFIPDRQEAIRQAIEKANPGDTVLILGKGDEPFIYRENGRAPWIGDDEAAREAIREVLRPESDRI